MFACLFKTWYVYYETHCTILILIVRYFELGISQFDIVWFDILLNDPPCITVVKRYDVNVLVLKFWSLTYEPMFPKNWVKSPSYGSLHAPGESPNSLVSRYASIKPNKFSTCRVLLRLCLCSIVLLSWAKPCFSKLSFFCFVFFKLPVDLLGLQLYGVDIEDFKVVA